MMRAAFIVCGTAVIWVIPLFFLFYLAIGPAVGGAVVMAVLIALQTVIGLPLWRHLQKMRDRQLEKSDSELDADRRSLPRNIQ